MRSIYLKLLLFFPVFCLAQIPVIETPDKKGGFEKDKNVILQKLTIETKITGRISTNVVTMVFKNKSSRIMEGRITFPLPEGVNVSGYALDINGKLRNAVPIEKTKAKEVFETIEKRRVDPGILEKVEGNSFRTRIYPISPNGGERTIQITYHNELKNSDKGYQFFLPLTYSSAIPQFHVKTTVYQYPDNPQLMEKPDGSYDFTKKGEIWTAETHQTNYKPSQDLRINFPYQEGSQAVILQKASQNSSYFLADIGINAKEKPKKLPAKLAIVWDNSLSGTKRNHIKEFELLNEYFKSDKDLSVKVYLINNAFEEGKNFKINDGKWSELKAYLSQVIYDGGTDFGKLEPVRESEILFFTDGLSSFGDLKMKWKQPVYTISASNNAHFNQLKLISNTTGGEFLNINENNPVKEVRKLLFQSLKFLGVEDHPEVTEVYPSLPQAVSNDFIVTGILKGQKTNLRLKFGYGNEVSEVKTLDLDASEQTVKDWEISQFWAQKKLNELEIFEKQNKNEIKNLSRQFGLVSNNMSLMVLEDIADYVRYEITPPSELRAEYDRLVKNNQVQKDQRVNDLMRKAENMTANLKKWWETDFDKKTTHYPGTKAERQDSMMRDTQIEEVVMVGYGQAKRVAHASSSSVVSELRANTHVLANLQGTAPGLSVVSGDQFPDLMISRGKIIVADIASDAEYMKFFTSAKTAEEIYQLYLHHRKEFSSLPRYYFDVSQLLFKNNDKMLGLKVLSSIADLDLENEELYKLLAYKLKQAEVFDKELWITQKVLEWRPFDPQSYRDYALALEDNGLYQAALDNLYKILNQTYTRELAARDYGIEETIIMEINELISRHRNDLNLKNINTKIIADLPVNIRVVINWNKDNTDIDLWVTDPNEERCMYSHKETAVGGRLSNDFTGGFGPEQFLLKKAIKGKYRIETNFYNENQVSIAGPTAIMAEIYIQYATGKQERKVVVFQNKSESDTRNRDGVLVGEFEF